jgi:hypothetical protein
MGFNTSFWFRLLCHVFAISMANPEETEQREKPVQIQGVSWGA